MESHKRRLILRTIVAVFLIAAAIGIIGALTPQQGAMQPTPTITSSLGAIPPYADRATATPPAVRVATGMPPVPTAAIVAHSDATGRAATPVAPATLYPHAHAHHRSGPPRHGHQYDQPARGAHRRSGPPRIVDGHRVSRTEQSRFVRDGASSDAGTDRDARPLSIGDMMNTREPTPQPTIKE